MTTRLSRRRYGAGVAALAGGILAAACGGGQGPAAEPRAPAKQPAKILVMTEFGPNSGQGPAYAALVEEVAKQAPWIEVDSQHPAGLWQVVQTNVAAGTPPDVADTYVANWATLGAQNIAAPLNELLKSARTWSLADYVEGVREGMNFKAQKVVIAPLFTAPMAVGVNLDLLQRAGLAAPPVAWTWEMFSDYAQKLTERTGAETTVWGAAMPTAAGFGSMNFFGGPLWSHGGDWADRRTDALTFHRPEGIAALEMWVQVALKQQAAPTAAPADWQGLPGGPFLNGKAAMAFIASEGMRSLYTTPPQFKWLIQQMPRKVKQGSHFYSHGLFVAQGSQQKEAAAEFVRISALPDQIAKWNTVALGMPTTKASAAHPIWKDFIAKRPEMRAFDATIAYMRGYPLIPRWNEASVGPEGIGQALLNAVQGAIAPGAAMEQAARNAGALLGVPVA